MADGTDIVRQQDKGDTKSSSPSSNALDEVHRTRENKGGRLPSANAGGGQSRMPANDGKSNDASDKSPSPGKTGAGAEVKPPSPSAKDQQQSPGEAGGRSYENSFASENDRANNKLRNDAYNATPTQRELPPGKSPEQLGFPEIKGWPAKEAEVDRGNPPADKATDKRNSDNKEDHIDEEAADGDLHKPASEGTRASSAKARTETKQDEGANKEGSSEASSAKGQLTKAGSDTVKKEVVPDKSAEEATDSKIPSETQKPLLGADGTTLNAAPPPQSRRSVDGGRDGGTEKGSDSAGGKTTQASSPSNSVGLTQSPTGGEKTIPAVKVADEKSQSTKVESEKDKPAAKIDLDDLQKHPEKIAGLNPNELKDALDASEKEMKESTPNRDGRPLGGDDPSNPANPFVNPSALYEPGEPNKVDMLKLHEAQKQASKDQEPKIFADERARTEAFKKDPFVLNRLQTNGAEQEQKLKADTKALKLELATPEQRSQKNQKDDIRHRELNDPDTRERSSLHTRLKDSPDKLTDKQQEFLAKEEKTQDRRNLHDHLAHGYKERQAEYDAKHWGPDSRETDDKKFLADIGSKDQDKVSDYDKRKGLAAIDRIRAQNSDVFSDEKKHPEDFTHKENDLMAAQDRLKEQYPGSHYDYYPIKEKNLTTDQQAMRTQVEQQEQDLRVGLARSLQSETHDFGKAVDDLHSSHGITSGIGDMLAAATGTSGGWGGMVLDSDATSSAVRAHEGQSSDNVNDVFSLAHKKFEGPNPNQQFLAAYDEKKAAVNKALGKGYEDLNKLAQAQQGRVEGVSDALSGVGGSLASMAGSPALGIATGAALKVGMKNLENATARNPNPALNPSAKENITAAAIGGLVHAPFMPGAKLMNAAGKGVAAEGAQIAARQGAQSLGSRLATSLGTTVKSTALHGAAGAADGALLEGLEAAAHGRDPAPAMARGVMVGGVLGGTMGTAADAAIRASRAHPQGPTKSNLESTDLARGKHQPTIDAKQSARHSVTATETGSPSTYSSDKPHNQTGTETGTTRTDPVHAPTTTGPHEPPSARRTAEAPSPPPTNRSLPAEPQPNNRTVSRNREDPGQSPRTDASTSRSSDPTTSPARQANKPASDQHRAGEVETAHAHQKAEKSTSATPDQPVLPGPPLGSRFRHMTPDPHNPENSILSASKGEPRTDAPEAKSTEPATNSVRGASEATRDQRSPKTDPATSKADPSNSTTAPNGHKPTTPANAAETPGGQTTAEATNPAKEAGQEGSRTGNEPSAINRREQPDAYAKSREEFDTKMKELETETKKLSQTPSNRRSAQQKEKITKNLEERMSLIDKRIEELHASWDAKIQAINEGVQKRLEAMDGPFSGAADSSHAVYMPPEQMAEVRKQWAEAHKQQVDQLTELSKSGIKQEILNLERRRRVLEIASAAEHGNLASTVRPNRVELDDPLLEDGNSDIDPSAGEAYRYRNSSSHADGTELHIKGDNVSHKEATDILKNSGKLPNGVSVEISKTDQPGFGVQGQYHPDTNKVDMIIENIPINNAASKSIQRAFDHEIGHAKQSRYFNALPAEQQKCITDIYRQWLDNPATQAQIGHESLRQYGENLRQLDYVERHEDFNAYLATFQELFAEMSAMHEFSKTQPKGTSYDKLIKKSPTIRGDSQRANIIRNAEPLYTALKRDVFEPFDNGK